MANDVHLDGSFGEGGGQIVRSSLALSLVTGKPVVLDNIRAGRKKPGLRQQHLTAVKAAAAVGAAQVEGAALGSRSLTFRPNQIQPGEYRFDVGTAGSTSLVLQTVLPALLTAEDTSQLVLRGGTHNPLAPPFDFLAKTYLPLLAELGPIVNSTLDRPGFYPAGGGQITVRVSPAADLGPLELSERGRIRTIRVRALVANLPRHIAERECRTIAEKLDHGDVSFAVEEIRDSAGPGNVVMIEAESERLTEVFTGFGQKGVKAETVAANVLREVQQYLHAKVPVGEHLADQLLLPLGLAACQGKRSVFHTLPLSQHALTHIEVLQRFLDIRVAIEECGPHVRRVEIGG